MNGPEPATAGRPEPAPSPGPQAGWRRLRRILWALGALSVLFALLHTPPAKRLVTSALISLAGRALNAEVSVEQLDYRLWGGEVRVDGVHVRSPRLEITCARAEAEVDLDLDIRARMEAPRVIVTQGPPSETHRSSRPSRPWTVLERVGEVDLHEGALELRDHEDVPWLRLEGLEAHVESPGGRTRGSARVARAGVGWPGAGIRVEPVRAAAEFELEPGSGAVRLLKGEVVTGETTLEGRGHLEQIRPIQARAEGGGRVDAGLLRQLVPDLEIEGGVDARATFETDADGARGSLEAIAAALRVFEVGPWDGPIRGRLEDRQLHVESLDLAGYGGRAEGSGVIFLGNGPSAVRVRARDLDAKTLVGTFVPAPPPLASRLDARLEVDIRDWEIDTLRAQGEVSLRPGGEPGWPVSGPVQVGLADRSVSFATHRLRVRSAHVETEGALSFAKDLDLRYLVRLPDLVGAPELLADAGLELPPLALGGDVGIEGEVTGRLPEWQATARITSEGLKVEEIDVGVHGALKVTRQGVEIESFEARGPDGSLSLAGFVPLDAARVWSLDGQVTELYLTDALGFHGVPLPTTARGRVRVEGPRDDPAAEFEVEARAGAAAADSESVVSGNGEKEKLLVEGEPPEDALPEREPATLRLAGSASRRGVVVDELTAGLGGGLAEASGTWLSDGGSLDGRVRIADVQLARLPWLPGPDALADLDSTLSGEADLSGRLDAPEGRLELHLGAIRYRDQTFHDVTIEADMNGTEARLGGRVGEESLLSGRLGFEERWPLHVDLELSALPLTTILRVLPGAARDERTLDLSGRASLDVPLLEPGQVRYEARVDALEMNLGAGGASAGPFTVSGSRESVALREFEVRSGESRLRAEGELGLASDVSVPLAIRGVIPLSEVAVLLPDTDLEGEVTADLTIKGRLADPDVTGELHLEGGAGRVGPVVLGEMALEASAASGVLAIRRAQIGVDGGEISARGSFPIGPRAEGVHTFEFELRGVDPGVLLPSRAGDPRLVAPLDVSGRLRATALALDAINAEGEITGWSVSAGPETLVLERPTAWRYEDGRLTLDDLRLRGDHGHLRVDGTWTPGGAVRLHLGGDTDLALLNPFLGGELQLSGPGRTDLTVLRDDAGLALEGRATLERARAALREPPVVVSSLAGTIEARGRDLELEANGVVGDGTVRVAGTVGLATGGPEIDLTLDAERVPLSYPEGLRSRTSARIRLTGRDRRYRVGGDVTVHRALFDRETDFANQSLDSLGAELQALEERGSVLERVQLDVRVRLDEGLRVQNQQLRVIVDGGVTLGGDLLTPEVQGSLSLRDGGTVKLSRATMRLVDGRVDLAGFPSRPPEIAVSGRTQVTGIQIDVDLAGPLDDLRTSLSSPNRSDLTQADLATLLLTGRTAQAAASESGAIVAEEVAAALGSALNERLGGAILIDVSRDESLIVQDTDPTQRFNVGIPIGERLYVFYSQAVDRSGTRWILDFRPTGQFRVRLITDSDETGAVEVSHSLDFDVWSRGGKNRPPRAPEVRVREIRVEGVPEAAAAELEREADLDPGDRWDFFEGAESAARMREQLVGEGYRAALVEARETAVGEGMVDVVFDVERGPRIEVEWRGDDPGKKLRERFGEAWDAYLSVEETAARRARALRDELRARRYYEAAVSSEVETTDGRTRITFDVRRGRRGRGVDLAFEGNASLPDAALAAVLPARDTAAFFALLDPGGATRLTTALRTAGARGGFLSLQVGTPRQTFPPGAERLQVTIPVEEGERATVSRYEIPEEVRRSDGAAPPDLKLRGGEPFRIDAYVDDRRTLSSWFREQGYPEARVAGILEPEPGGLAVTFAVDAGPRPTVGEVRPESAGRTRRSVIDDAVTLKPGDLIRPEDLARSRDHLSETRVFRSVDVRAETTGDAAVRDLVVDLAERPDLSVEYKVRYETGGGEQSADAPEGGEASGFQFGVGVEAANPFGRAHRYSVYGLVGGRRALYGTSFDSQTFFGRRWQSQVFLFDDSDREFQATSLTRRVRSAAFQQTKRWRSGLAGRRWHDRLRMQWGYSYRRIDYLDPATGTDLGGNRAGISDSLIGDTRDSVTDPHRGLFWTVTVEPALKALGSDKDFVKLYGQVFAYIPLGKEVVWAQALRIGVTPGDDPLLLLDRRFKAGGATTVRGFAENGLGPQYTNLSIGGQALFVFNQELRFPLPFWDRLYGGVFYDTGNVWALADELDLRTLRSNVGAGVRIMFPFGPVRIDWAWVLDPQDGEPRSRWQFALGHAY